MAPNCFSCGLKSLPNAKINSCKHTILERAIQGTYCISEVNYALKLGYKILKIFSCIVYKTMEPLLRKFVSILGFEKLTSTDFDSNFNLTEMKNKMFFEKDLTPEHFKENLQKRNFSKLALNSFFLIFFFISDLVINKLVSSEEEMSKYFYSKTFDITSLFALNEHFCQIQLKRKRKTLTPPNARSNCILGAQVVAFSREFMHQKMLELDNVGAEIFYIDTDSLIFSLKKNQNMPLNISPCFGDFKFEIPQEYEILNYFSLGPRNFAIQFETDSGEIKELIKLRGVTLSNVVNKKVIDSKIYDFYLKQFLKNKTIRKAVPQVRSKISKHKKLKTQNFQKVFFSNSIKAKRIIDKQSKNLTSNPFGFTNNF